MRVDGDIIRQQNEVLNWQAEGAGSMQVRSLHEGSLLLKEVKVVFSCRQDIQSVCSCTCNSCIPFQQINRRLGQEGCADDEGYDGFDDIDDNETVEERLEDKHAKKKRGGGKKGKWASTDSLRTSQAGSRAMTPVSNKRRVFAKAESIHDIYRGQFLDVDGIELPSPLRTGTTLEKKATAAVIRLHKTRNNQD